MAEDSAPKPPGFSGERAIPFTETKEGHQQELGWLGKVFGGKDHAPIYIPGAVILLGFVGLITLPLFPSTPDLTHGDMAKIFSGLIVSAITFLGGYLGSGKDKG